MLSSSRLPGPRRLGHTCSIHTSSVSSVAIDGEAFRRANTTHPCRLFSPPLPPASSYLDTLSSNDGLLQIPHCPQLVKRQPPPALSIIMPCLKRYFPMRVTLSMEKAFPSMHPSPANVVTLDLYPQHITVSLHPPLFIPAHPCSSRRMSSFQNVQAPHIKASTALLPCDRN